MAQEQQREEFLIRDRVTGQPRPYYVAADNINLGDDENYQSLPDTLKEMQDDIDAASGGGGGECTVTAVKMNNGTPIKPNNDGVVDLGTVITSHQSLAALFCRVAYDGTTHRINFYGKDDVSMTTVLGCIDCSPFIVDGILSNVEVKNVTINNVSTPCMVFSFNTDAGKQNINIPVSSIFNSANYYTKDDADGRFQLKLVSGTNIKTVNNTSILGDGNINVSAGADGVTPHIGANGNWWVGPETDSNNDTGIKAQGHKGDKGDTVVVGDEEEFTIVNDLTTGGESDALSAEMGKRLALTTGTYEQAWQRSKVITGLFSFIWDEMGFKKPIWHVGNSVFVDAAGGIVSAAQAANVPADPTFTSNGSSISDNSSVAKNTQVTITPATNSVLYYRIGSSGDYTASLSAVTLTLATAGSVVLSAYCVNTKGNSNTSTLNLTVEGTQVPTFAAKSGTTIDNNDVVSRGGHVVITGAVGGTLKYKVGSASSYTEVAGVGDIAPSAEVQITGATIIKAYNVVDGDDSDEITKNYTMAALAAPTLSPNDNTEFPAGGGNATITATEGDGIRYTTDGSDPASSVTATVVQALSASVTVSSAVTIKACAYDDYGKSAVVQATYSVETAKLKVTASAATTMTLTKTDDSTVDLTIAQGDNEFAIDTALGGVTTFASCAFGDKTLITKVDFGWITVNSIASLFSGSSAITSCINLNVNGSAASAFYNCYYIAHIKLGGVITDATSMCCIQNGTHYAQCDLDLSAVTSLTNIYNAFKSFWFAGPIDLSAPDVTITRLDTTFRDTRGPGGSASNKQPATLIIRTFDVASTVGTQYTFYDTLVRTIKCTSLTPPTMGKDWLTQFKSVGGANAKILVPAAAETAYKTASGWSTYADIMETY